MEFPSLMPKELDPYLSSSSEDLLFASLVHQPDDLVLFFETACDDETWTENHEAFMKKLAEWLTAQVYRSRLSKHNYTLAAKAIQKHYHILKTIIPNNIQVKLKDAAIPSNGLLLTAASDFFKQILVQAALKESHVLAFPQLSEAEFSPVGAFIATGSVPKLAIKGQEEIIELIKRAKAWELPELSIMCSNMLRKYLNTENVFDILIQAKSEGWEHLEGACIEFIDRQDWDFKLSMPSQERLAFEFLNFHEPTIDFFEGLRPNITDIICGGVLTELAQFGLILKECPDLFSLDISRSSSFSNQLQEIPVKLRSLNVSECRWMSKETINTLFKWCPNLEQLSLQSNTQLNYAFWGELVKIKKLNRLDLTNCSQLQDSDLSIIINGLSSLTDLSLNNCTKIGEKGFLELAKSLPRLIKIYLARTHISDTALVEIVSRCRSLSVLDISGCKQVSEKGILAAVKNALSLKEFNIAYCSISDTAVAEIRLAFPQLKLQT